MNDMITEAPVTGFDGLKQQPATTSFTIQPGDRVTVQISRPLGINEPGAMESIGRIVTPPPIEPIPIPPVSNINITGFAPLSGAPNTRLSIFGSGLGAVTGVTVGGQFGGLFAAFDPTGVRNNNQIDVLVPAAAQMVSGPVCVFTPNTLAICSVNSFTIIPATVTLNITGFNPGSGTTGSIVSITGSGFNGASVVSFGNNVRAPFTVFSDTFIQARVPAGAQTGPIIIQRGGVTVRSSQVFTVL